MRIESNLSEKIVKIVGILNNDTVAQEKALRVAALDAVALVQSRIQQDGKGVNGQLSSKAKTRFGAYSSTWGKTRSMMGRQTGFIDWTFDGNLFRAWQLLSISGYEALIGFNDSTKAELAEWLEAKHGQAFALTDAEQSIVAQSFIDTYRKESELL